MRFKSYEPAEMMISKKTVTHASGEKMLTDICLQIWIKIYHVVPELCAFYGRMGSQSVYIADPRVVQDYSADPSVLQDSHSDYSADQF